MGGNKGRGIYKWGYEKRNKREGRGWKCVLKNQRKRYLRNKMGKE